MTPDMWLKLKEESERRGYRFERDPDGTERMVRPDGTVAVIAIPKAKETTERAS